MQKVVKRARHVLKDDYDIRNLRHHAHKESDIRMSQDTLHYDFVIDFIKKLIRQPGIEYLLDCNRAAV